MSEANKELLRRHVEKISNRKNMTICVRDADELRDEGNREPVGT